MGGYHDHVFRQAPRLHVESSQLAMELFRIRRHLLDTEREQVIQAFRHGELSLKSQETLRAGIDARLVGLESGQPKVDTPSRPSEVGRQPD
jgi:hypothetical protein